MFWDSFNVFFIFWGMEKDIGNLIIVTVIFSNIVSTLLHSTVTFIKVSLCVSNSMREVPGTPVSNEEPENA